MDKIFSARVDESIIKRIGLLAQKLSTTKKSVIENAILVYSEQVETDKKLDILERTFGAWQRDESPDKTVKHVRDTFRKSMERHKK